MAGKSAPGTAPAERNARGTAPARKLRIRLVRSTIGCVPAHRATVKALGLRKRGAVVEHSATPSILGMVRAVGYLLEVEEIG
jgi:large subunit ribosomal protein L30